MPRAGKAHNSDKMNPFFFLQKLIRWSRNSSAPMSSPSFKALPQIVIKISCSQEKSDEWTDPYLKCPQQVWHMLRTYADFRVNRCGSWRMSADVRYKSADVRASVNACGLLRTVFRISWGYLFADVRSSVQVSLRTSAKACVKFWLCFFLLRTCADILDLEKIRHWSKLHMSA